MIVIRTQDKMKMMDCKKIEISPTNEKNIFVMCGYDTASGSWNWLGEYENKERALEILDIIEQAINESYLEPEVVFQMPKE